jgi:hypothetical protein
VARSAASDRVESVCRAAAAVLEALATHCAAALWAGGGRGWEMALAAAQQVSWSHGALTHGVTPGWACGHIQGTLPAGGNSWLRTPAFIRQPAPSRGGEPGVDVAFRLLPLGAPHAPKSSFAAARCTSRSQQSHIVPSRSLIACSPLLLQGMHEAAEAVRDSFAVALGALAACAASTAAAAAVATLHAPVRAAVQPSLQHAPFSRPPCRALRPLWPSPCSGGGALALAAVPLLHLDAGGPRLLPTTLRLPLRRELGLAHLPERPPGHPPQPKRKAAQRLLGGSVQRCLVAPLAAACGDRPSAAAAASLRTSFAGAWLSFLTSAARLPGMQRGSRRES